MRTTRRSIFSGRSKLGPAIPKRIIIWPCSISAAETHGPPNTWGRHCWKRTGPHKRMERRVAARSEVERFFLTPRGIGLYVKGHGQVYASDRGNDENKNFTLWGSCHG